MTDLDHDHMSALKESILRDKEPEEAPVFVAPLSGTITLSNFMSLSDPEKHAFMERGGMIAGL
jgi:hypothetical protein